MDWAIWVCCSRLEKLASSDMYCVGSLGFSGSWFWSWSIISFRKSFSPRLSLGLEKLVPDVPVGASWVPVVPVTCGTWSCQGPLVLEWGTPQASTFTSAEPERV